MKIAFIVNRVETEMTTYTTVWMALRALQHGYTFYLIDAADLFYKKDGGVGGFGRTLSGHKYRSIDKFLEAVKAAVNTRVDMADMDILFVRTDPSAEKPDRLWAQSAPYMFARHAQEHDDCIVLNDPAALAESVNKLYFQHFPEELRPKAIITRNEEQIREFYKEHDHRVILKPLQGSGGENVFLVEKKTEKNMNQIIEAISRDGYVIAQEYLPAGNKGDIRVLLMNGEILMEGDKPAIMRRVNEGADIRSNISAGGSYERVELSPEIERIANLLRPKLIQDGLFFIGVDIVGDKLIEINVFSAGGVPMVNELYDARFDEVMLHALEKKVSYKKDYGRNLSNRMLNTI